MTGRRAIGLIQISIVITLINLALLVTASSVQARTTCNNFQYNNFNECTFNDLTASGNEIPFTSPTVVKERQITTSAYTTEPGEGVGCDFSPSRIAWGGKTAWIRFLSNVSGVATVTAGNGTYDAVLAVWYSPTLEPSSFSDLVHLACIDGFRTGDEKDTERVNAGQPLHIQIRGWCADQTTNLGTPASSTCSDYQTTPPTASGVRSVSIAFTCDNGDGDAICDTLDTCPTESGPLANGCPLRPPTASFNIAPNPALIGEPIGFNGSGSTDPDGSIVRYTWDLDGNGSFETDTGSRSTTSRSYGAGGRFTIRLRVTDNHGNTNVTSRTLTVTHGDPLDPEAKLKFRDASNGVKVTSLVLTNVERGSRVEVTCHRAGRRACRRQVVRRAVTAKGRVQAARTVSFRRLRGKRLRAGTLLAIRVTKSGRIGKYIRYRILRKDFKKIERCMPIGSKKPRRRCS